MTYLFNIPRIPSDLLTLSYPSEVTYAFPVCVTRSLFPADLINVDVVSISMWRDVRIMQFPVSSFAQPDTYRAALAQSLPTYMTLPIPVRTLVVLDEVLHCFPQSLRISSGVVS